VDVGKSGLGGFCFLLAGCLYMSRDFPSAPVRNIETIVTTQKEILDISGNPLGEIWKRA
jgi:hypothetical protein